ncbi:hypothetical protein C8J56DRAFT_881641 [Mycena floridula]|nr:hypothetical protein C8J56DRAFT_881641 [Mycena floridula]
MFDDAAANAQVIKQIGRLLSQFLCLPRGTPEWIQGLEDLLRDVHPLMENHVLYLAIHDLQDIGQFLIARHFLTSLMIHVPSDRLPEGIYAWTIDSSFQPGEVLLFRPVGALAIMGGRAAAPILIHEPRPSFATSQSSSTTMSMATLAQILQQNPGLVLSPLSSVAPPSTRTPVSSKPVNTDNLFVAPMPSDASFKPVVHKFLQPSPRPSVEPVVKKSTSKSLRKTEAPAVAATSSSSSSRKPSKVIVEVPMRRTKAVYSNEEDVEEAVIELLSDEYKHESFMFYIHLTPLFNTFLASAVLVSSAKHKVVRPPSWSPSPDQQASMPGRRHLLASSEIVDVQDLLVPHLQHSEKISYNELNLLRADDMVHVLAGACSFCASSPVKSSLCEKAICCDGSHDNCALCSADCAKCRYSMRGKEATLHAVFESEQHVQALMEWLSTAEGPSAENLLPSVAFSIVHPLAVTTPSSSVSRD